MSGKDLIKRLTLGAAAGFAGTLALQGLRTGSQKWLPATMMAMRKDPGEFMVEQAKSALPTATRAQLPALAETAAARFLAVGYGLTAGVLYAALRPGGGSPIVDGIALGLVVWAAGYLGWLPALKLAPPVTEQPIAASAGTALRHALFGVVTVAAYRRLRSRV
jgi:putative membrane protein